ncbi:MAG: DNA polymerase I [Patescibacteria group bacterium]
MASPNKQPTALLIDANALIHRAWHALPPLKAPDGRIVNAVYGFSSVLMNIAKLEHPDYLVVCWDTPEPTYRHVAMPSYKAQRVEQPDEFYDQFPLVKDVVEAFGAVNVELPGYEADDLLGTLATRLADDGVKVTLLTSDKDIWQMISPNIRVMAFKKGVSETVIYDEAMLKEVTGLTPSQIIDFKALRGDASDNLKGVPGIGEKTATELLLKFHDLEGIFKAARDAKSDMSASVRQKLMDGEAAAEETYPIVKLVIDAPVKLKNSDLLRKPADVEEVKQQFLTYGFKSLVSRLLTSKPDKPAAGAPITRTEPVERNKKAAKNVTRLSPTKTVAATGSRKTISSAKDLSAFLDEARKDGLLVVRPLEIPQASLFAETPGLALGSKETAVVLSSSALSDKAVMKALANAFEDKKLEKIGHGLKEAWHWCATKKMNLDGIGFDTQIASYLLSSGESGNDLPSVTASRLGVVFPDSDEKPFAEVEAIRALRPLLQKELADQGMTKILERFELPLIPILGEMENRGVMIDRDYFKTLQEDFRKVKTRLEKEMVKLAGEDFNPASPGQLSHVLFETLKIPSKGIKRGKTGLSTAASELEKLEGAHPIIEKISEYREVSKLLSTYVETLPSQTDTDGRVHTTYIQIGAATGRMASTNPNLQNIPIRTELGRKIRRGFVASPGFTLLSCDYSQIELRVIAALAHDEKMLEAFRQNLDIHTATAAAIWHIPIDEVTKDQRRAAKAINFGIIYGQGPQGLSKAAGVPFQEARAFIDEYFHVYSGIREYLDQTKALAHKLGYVETLFGRRRPIPEINSPLPQMRAAAERMAINMPVQGTATGDLIKLALIALHEKLPKEFPDTRMLLQVHDELVFEVPIKDVKNVAARVKDIMENVEKIGCPIVADAKFGSNWEEMQRVAD